MICSKTGIANLLLAVVFFQACHQAPEKLPVLGKKVIAMDTITGKADTLYAVIPAFRVMNQDSAVVTNDSFAGKIYIADFIFLSCPSICPVMTKQMKRVYDAYAGNNQVCFLSYTIDPENDTIPRLKKFATQLGVQAPKWHFVTALEDTIYQIADGYYATVFPDSTVAGGFTHSGGFLLIDKQRHIRGAYEGTEPAEVNKLIKDIGMLLTE